MTTRFSVVGGTPTSRANTVWAIKNRFPFRTLGALSGTEKDVYQTYTHNRRFRTVFQKDYEAGDISYAVYGGRWGYVLAYYRRNMWIIDGYQLYERHGDIIRKALPHQDKRICEVL